MPCQTLQDTTQGQHDNLHALVEEAPCCSVAAFTQLSCIQFILITDSLLSVGKAASHAVERGVCGRLRAAR